MKKFIFAFPVVALLAAGCSSSSQSANQTPAQNPTPTQTTQSAWATYQNSDLGFSINYPNDGTYTANLSINQNDLPHSAFPVEATSVIGSLVTISQPPSANRGYYQIFVTSDSHILTTVPVALGVTSTKSINGLVFQVLTSRSLGATAPLPEYAYSIQHNGLYYVIKSEHGDDSTFEQMMTTFKFN